MKSIATLIRGRIIVFTALTANSQVVTEEFEKKAIHREGREEREVENLRRVLAIAVGQAFEPRASKVVRTENR